MQFYALDKHNTPVSAHRASKKRDYFCVQCKSRVRLRSGDHLKHHFFHIDPNRKCVLHQKGMIHLQLQDYLLKHLPDHDGQMEYRFKEINRIADVVWLSEKIVFEIQFSPISTEEVLARIQDYSSLGWTVVWILHDFRYNQFVAAPAEKCLIPFPHYYSNMNAKGVGMIYDQFQMRENGFLVESLKKIPVDLSSLHRINNQNPIVSDLKFAQKRIDAWSVFFSGDLIDLSTHQPNSDYFQESLKREKAHEEIKRKQRLKKLWDLPTKLFFEQLVHRYQIFFRFLLEKSCR